MSDASSDAFYDLGAAFLELPARATRDGPGGEVVSTSVDLEVWGALPLPEPGSLSAVQPPYLAVAFEPATGRLLASRVVSKTSAFEAYDDLLWGFIQSYLGRGSGGANPTPGVAPRPPAHRPAVLTSTDIALADYVFGVIQGCGTEVHHLSPDNPVQWPAVSVAADGTLTHPSGEAGTAGHPPLLRDAIEHVRVSLVESGLAASLLCDAHRRGSCQSGGDGGGGGGNGLNVEEDHNNGDNVGKGCLHALGDGASGGAGGASVHATGDATSEVQLVLLGACHSGECARLVPRSCLKRCSTCKVSSWQPPLGSDHSSCLQGNLHSNHFLRGCLKQLPPPAHCRRPAWMPQTPPTCPLPCTLFAPSHPQPLDLTPLPPLTHPRWPSIVRPRARRATGVKRTRESAPS
jgi:hypothetical protein